MLALALLAGVVFGTVLRALLRRSPAVPRRQWGTAPEDPAPVDDDTRELWRIDSTGSSDESVDEHTWLDLDLDSVVAAIDRTSSLVGRQTLYAAVRQPGSNTRREARLRLVDRFIEDPVAREHAGLVLATLGRKAGASFWHVTRPGLPAPPWWHVILPVMAAISVGSLIATLFVPAFLAVFVLSLLANAFIRAAVYWSGGTVEIGRAHV